MNDNFWSNQLYNDFYIVINNFYNYNLTSYQSGTHPNMYVWSVFWKKLNITLNGIAQIQKCCEADEIGFESFKNGVLQQ